jgi:mRNA interferase RelE/StbE
VRYKVIIRPVVKKALLKLREPAYSTIIDGLRLIEKNPRPPSAKKLTGSPLWRLRAGDFRLVYFIDDKERIVTVVRVRRRSEDTYKGL